MTMAVMMLAVTAVMLTLEARATATAVMSLTTSRGGNGSSGRKTDVCNAILLQYTDIVNDGATTMATMHLPSTEAILMGGLPMLTMACSAHARVSNNGGERAATMAAAVVAVVGRESTVRQTKAGTIRMEGGWGW
jgi:hypothetical protein